MNKLKVLTLVGTRPEIIRLSCLIKELERTCNHVLVHSGQNYDPELNHIFFSDLEISEPQYYLDVASQSGSVAETIGNIISKSDKVFDEIKPEALLLLGDTNSCLAAIPAKRRKIPIFHMEAGNRCFDLRVPEEINRKIVDSIADINLTYSTIAREYLLAEGFPASRIIKTGSPMKEVLLSQRKRIEASNVLKAQGLKEGEFFVFSVHREENLNSDEKIKDLLETLSVLAVKYNYPIVFSTHPRTRKRFNELGVDFHPLVKLCSPFNFSDYIKLQKSSFLVLSDSGTISEEASLEGFKALNLREVHERPEAMEEAAVILTSMKVERILQAIEILLNQSAKPNLVYDYNVDNFSGKVLKIIHSYVDYVHRDVWRKY